MKKILKLIGFYKVNDVLDLFVLNGIVKRESLMQNKINQRMLFAMIILIAISTIISNTFILFLILILPGGAFIYFGGVSLDVPLFKKHFRRFLKKQFKGKLNKTFNIDMKNKDFKKFIKEYYDEIKMKEMSKKETIKFINNWEKKEKELNNIRKERLSLYKKIEKLNS